jgi:hypothetical protein
MVFVRNGTMNAPFCKPEPAWPAVAPGSVILLRANESFEGSSFSWYENTNAEKNHTIFDVLHSGDRNRMSQQPDQR